MRLDLFLKAARLFPRRTIAQKVCDAGFVSINGAKAKPAHPVKSGDEITIRRREKISTLKVLSIPSDRQTAKQDVGNLYEMISEQRLTDDP